TDRLAGLFVADQTRRPLDVALAPADQTGGAAFDKHVWAAAGGVCGSSGCLACQARRTTGSTMYNNPAPLPQVYSRQWAWKCCSMAARISPCDNASQCLTAPRSLVGGLKPFRVYGLLIRATR